MEEIFKKLAISGHITGKGEKHTVYQLKYAKAESLLLLRMAYKRRNGVCLSRKKLKIQIFLKNKHQEYRESQKALAQQLLKLEHS